MKPSSTETSRGVPCAGITFGVQLDAVGAGLARQAHRVGFGVHEQAHANAERFRFGDQRTQPFGVCRHVPAVVGRGLRGGIRHEGALLRAEGAAGQLAQQLHQVVEWIAFDVELGLRPALQQRGEFVHVVPADVALVGPRMHGDALGAGPEHDRRHTRHVRDADVARVAQQCDAVEVDRQRGARAAGGGIGGDERVHSPISLSVCRMTSRERSSGEPR